MAADVPSFVEGLDDPRHARNPHPMLVGECANGLPTLPGEQL